MAQSFSSCAERLGCQDVPGRQHILAGTYKTDLTRQHSVQVRRASGRRPDHVVSQHRCPEFQMHDIGRFATQVKLVHSRPVSGKLDPSVK